MSAGSLYIPTIQTQYFEAGMLDAKTWAALLATGVIDTQTLESEIAKNHGSFGGDFVNMPEHDRFVDFSRQDITSDSEATPTKVGSTDDKAVVLRAYGLQSWKRSDMIRTGEAFEPNLSRSAGEKVAKYMTARLADSLVGCMQAMDTPSADVHTKNIFTSQGGTPTTGALTVQAVRQAKNLLEDEQENLETMWLHPDTWTDLLRDMSVTYKELEGVGAVVINNARPNAVMGVDNIIVSNQAPTSFVAGGSSSSQGAIRYHTYFFGRGAIAYAAQKEPEVESEDQVRVPTTVRNMKVSMSFVAHPRRVAYAAAGANPTAATLRLGATWNEAYQDHRDVQIVELISNGGVYA